MNAYILEILGNFTTGFQGKTVRNILMLE